MMNVKIVPAARLSELDLSAWSRLQQADSAYANPFYRPEFTEAVASHRPGVEVAVMEEGGEPVGFWPFERIGWRAGQAVGACINQFQGAIVRRGIRWNPRDVLRAAGLRICRFDHLPAADVAFADHQYAVEPSPYLDLSQGFEHYRDGRGESAARFVARIQQKERKASRELGDVCLATSTTDGDGLRRLLAWKMAQCRARRAACVYSVPWIARLHERLLGYASDDFTGVLYTLSMGGRPAAGFFCLRSGAVLQGSVLGYDRELSQYAPGLVLLMRVAQVANAQGIARIEMGKGDEPYKRRIASGEQGVAEGRVLSRPELAPLYRGWAHLRARLRASPLGTLVRRVRRAGAPWPQESWD